MISKVKNILFIGPPGAGKGSLTLMLESKQKYKKMVCGDIWRHHIRNETFEGKKFISYINRGELVPDYGVNEMMEKEFSKKFFKNSNTLNQKDVIIWDGYPRNIVQANYFDKFLKKVNLKLDLVIWVDVKLKIIIDRIVNRLTCSKCNQIYNKITNPPKKADQCDKCQSKLYVRSDDQASLIETRYNEFLNETKPLLEFYLKQNRVKKIDGSKNLEELFNECLELVKNA